VKSAPRTFATLCLTGTSPEEGHYQRWRIWGQTDYSRRKDIRRESTTRASKTLSIKRNRMARAEIVRGELRRGAFGLGEERKREVFGNETHLSEKDAHFRRLELVISDRLEN